ncbi:MAG TPA: hypothetical protein VN554_01905, partial [Verrucomicrobiae bacterium]|nr:hypothetical protein [Verrucomicrobiae bacterium]
LAILGVVVVTFGTVYAAVQQAERRDANYPQIQLAEDEAAQINGAGNVYAPSSFSPVDMKTSLAPFVIVYDKNGHMVSGSGYLNGKVPTAPLSMLQAAKGEDYHAVTWQPANGVRIASVTVASKGYYVLSGRSLKEVEKNENQTLLIILIGGLVSLILVGAAIGGRILFAEP